MIRGEHERGGRASTGARAVRARASSMRTDFLMGGWAGAKFVKILGGRMDERARPRPARPLAARAHSFFKHWIRVANSRSRDSEADG